MLNYYNTQKNNVDSLISMKNEGRDNGKNISFLETTYEEYKMRRKSEYLTHEPKLKKNAQINKNFTTKKGNYSTLAKSSHTKYGKLSRSMLKRLKNQSSCTTSVVVSNPGTNSGVYNSRTLLFLDTNVDYHSTI